MRNFNTVLKIAPAFLLAGTMLHAQVQDSTVREKKIEEVVLIGYGSKKKSDLTGSITAVSEKDFNKGAVTNVEGLINGRASGVVITQSGTPGNDSTIRIRGGSSLLASNDPLVVIDGLPITGGLASINPNDIESFSILKDASSTAIYGNRGSNGVILITTKKGSKKKLQISFNGTMTINTLDKKVDVYDANTYRELIAKYAPSKSMLLGKSETDWQKEIFRNTATLDVNVSLLGNLFNVIPSRLTIGNTDNEGLLLTSGFKRSTAAISLNPTLFNDHLKFNITGNYSYSFRTNTDSDSEGAIGSAISYDPTQSVYTASGYNPNIPYQGYTEWTSNGNLNGTPRGVSNPVAQLLERRAIGNHKRFFGNINMEYKFHFLPELRAIVNAGLEKMEGDEHINISKYSRMGIWNNQFIGREQDKWYDNSNKNLNTQLAYGRKFGQLSLDLLGGYEYQQFDKKNYDSANKLLYILDPSNNQEDIYTDPGVNLQAFFGRVNIGWKNNRYLLTGNFRRDGSSRFSKDNRWGNFGGVAFAWKMNEDLFKNNADISELKLRLSVGAVGQQDIGDYKMEYFKSFDISNNAYYQFGNTFYLVARPRGYNQNLTWESSTKYNVGIDFGFFGRRLNGSLDAYMADTKNLLSIVAEGALQNLRVLGPRNIGSLQSKGIDFGLNYQAVKKENVTFDINYNLTYNHLEITDLFTDNIAQGNVGLGGTVQTHKVGLAPYSYWVYQQVYDSNGMPIDGVFVDRNNDGTINSLDKYNFKKPQADVLMGLMLSATFNKKWDFSTSWRASFGNYVYDRVNADRGYLIGSVDNQVDNTLGNAPTDFSNTLFSVSRKESDYYIKNGSFLKWDNATVGYTIKNMLGENTSLRLFGAVQNVLTITKYNNIDPEVFNNGIDGVIYPRARMFSLGLNANF